MKTLKLSLRVLAALAFVVAAQSCATQRNFIEVVYYGDSEDTSQQLAQKQVPAKTSNSSESSNVKVTQ